MTFRVALVEDDPRLRGTITRGLRDEGLEVVFAVGTGGELLSRIPKVDVDVLVLDIGLPDCDGRDLCLALRAAGVQAPVLFLTALDAVADRLLGFHAGADDYLPKPFSFAELVVRVNALGRRHVPAPVAPSLLVLDPRSHSARLGDRVVSLTPTEYRLLSTLLAHRGEVVRRRSVVAAAWPDGSIVHDNTLDAYMARIRRKLRGLEAAVDTDGQPAASGQASGENTLVTVRGVGYRIG